MSIESIEHRWAHPKSLEGWPLTVILENALPDIAALLAVAKAAQNCRETHTSYALCGDIALALDELEALP